MKKKSKAASETKEPKKKTTTRLGFSLDEVASSLQKEIRAGNTEKAVYWAMLLYGTSPWYAMKRVLVCAVEDIGLADLDTVRTVYCLAAGWQVSKAQSWYVSPHALTLSVCLLCRAPKSTEIEDLQTWTLERIKAGVKLPVESYSIDAHTEVGKARGATWSEWYDSRHLLFGIPVNKYTKELADMMPEWFSQAVRDLLAKE